MMKKNTGLNWLLAVVLSFQFFSVPSIGQASELEPAPLALSAVTPRIALTLDGNGDYMRVPYDPALNPSSGLTISAWVYREDSSRCETVVGMDYQTGYWLGFCSSTIRFYPRGSGSAVDGTIPIPEKTWTHIAVTYDGTTRRYFVNGVLDIATTALNGPLTFTTSDLGIGSDPRNGYDFLGKIDDVQISSSPRNINSIRMGMHGPVYDYAPIDVYPLNNNTLSLAREGRAGVLMGDASFTSLGARYEPLIVPQTVSQPVLDGICQPGEYGVSSQVDVGSATAYLNNTTTDLYVCMAGLNNGPGAATTVSISDVLYRLKPTASQATHGVPTHVTA